MFQTSVKQELELKSLKKISFSSERKQTQLREAQNQTGNQTEPPTPPHKCFVSQYLPQGSGTKEEIEVR